MLGRMDLPLNLLFRISAAFVKFAAVLVQTWAKTKIYIENIQLVQYSIMFSFNIFLLGFSMQTIDFNGYGV